MTNTELQITDEMINNPAADAVLINYGAGCAMRMEVVAAYYIYWDIGMDQLPEDVDYSVDAIIDHDDCR